MTLKRLAPLALLPLLAACADDPDPWLARGAVAADVEPMAQTLVRTHYRLGPDCEPLPAPAVAVLEPGLLGEIFTRDSVKTIEAPEVEEDEVAEEAPCAGVTVPATEVWYAAGEVPGIDALVYREITEGAVPSRDWLTTVRVR